MNQHSRSRIVRHAAGVAALAVFAVGCGGSSDGGESEVSTPASDVSAPVVTEAPVETAAPVVSEAPVVTDPVEIPTVPCAEYVDESGYPLKPCDKGVLTETLQRDLESLFPGIAIDGLFGGQTFDFIKEYQTSVGLEATGLVSEELAGQIAAAESLGDLGSDASTTPDDTTADTTDGEG